VIRPDVETHDASLAHAALSNLDFLGTEFCRAAAIAVPALLKFHMMPAKPLLLPR